MRCVRSLLIPFFCLLGSSPAHANGRPPGTSTINFKIGDETKIFVGLTFGALSSTNGGVTWNWTCEQAVGYGGQYDPDYAFTSSGAIFATTFDGLKVNRDRCVFDPSPLSPTAPAIKFFSTVTTNGNGVVYAAAADPADGKIYRSTDDGLTFPASVMPAALGDWWQSMEVAPSDSTVVYLFGYRFSNNQKTLLLFRSGDSGQSFQPLPITDFAVMPNSVIEIAGVSKTDANILYARVTLADNNISDALYRSVNGGQTWTKILELLGSTAFVARANGDLVAGTRGLGSFVSTNNGADWTPLVGAPQIGCLTENALGEVWACTQNFGTPQFPADGFGIMKSTDLASWTGVLRYQDINLPEPCPDGTVQKMECDAELWCGLCAQLGCDAKRTCVGPGDPPPDGLTVDPPDKGGCCGAGDNAPTSLLLTLALGLFVFRRRARASCLVLVACGLASSELAQANGRPPSTNGVFFQPNDNDSIYVRTTFGLVVSHDDGCTFRWVCEQNIGYGGTFDPKYAVDSEGTLYATTFEGLRISRDGGCSFTTATSELPEGPGRIADIWVDALSLSSTGDVWVATAESARANDIYRSTDKGVTFEPRGLSSPTVWYKSVAVAPSDPLRVYVTGYEVAMGGTDAPRAHFYSTIDGGDNWTESALANVRFAATPVTQVVAVDPANPLLLYMVSNGVTVQGDVLYRSADGGTTFTEVLETAQTIQSVVVVDATTVMVATGTAGTFKSIDAGVTFAPVENAPQLSCLGKRPDGTLVGCGTNWDPDFKAVAISADGSQWNKAFRFVELAGPVDCPAGTAGKDMCDAELWSGLQQQFGATGPTCGVVPDVTPTEPPTSGGCCDAGSDPPVGPALLALLTLGLLIRRARRTA